MPNAEIRSLSGSTVTIPQEDLAKLQSALGGSIHLPGSAVYDEARTVWNATVDKRPGAVVRCIGVSDVMQAVRFAKQNDLLVAVRAGGHNIAGKAVADGALLIDLSQMRAVTVDPAKRRAHVSPGARLADFDRETQAFGLTAPMGINSTTGVAGLTLGGGFGWTTRAFGMSVDALAGADIVLADGELHHVSASENPDLFWALRGGGGNFGVVTRFEFELHPLGPKVLSGLIVHPFADAPEVLKKYRALVSRMPDELTVWTVLRKAPPLPFLPVEWHGREVMVLAACYAGDPDAGAKAMGPLRAIGRPIADVIGLNPFAGWQQAFDPLLTPGARNYWKSHDFVDLSDPVLEELTGFSARLPTDECEIFIAHLGGAMGRVAADATAFAGRETKFVMNVHTRWQDPHDDARCIQWAREFFAATKPYAAATAYVNFLSDEDGDRLTSTYGGNYARLAEVKARHDPGNMFRVNQNIRS
jgi:FAD/FMN-containing dehydrogenase